MAVQYGTSAIGLVSEKLRGPGSLAEERITAIARHIPPGVASFLLTGRQEVTSIIAQQRRCRVNAVQLCNPLAPGAHAELRAALPGVPIVQVIYVTGAQALKEAQTIAPHVDGIVLDSGQPDPSRPVQGGTGRTHDWNISRRICQALRVPVFLAGGLTAANVTAAIRHVRPYGVDLCSGVRTLGKLDEEKVRTFFATVNAITAQ